MSFQVRTDPSDISTVSLALASPPRDHVILESGFAYVPADPDAPPPTLPEDEEERLDALCRQLAEDPDVEAVWTLSGQYDA